MKLEYDPETDSLYLDLSGRQSVETEEVAPGVMFDFDGEGQVAGIDIDNASQTVDLTKIEASDFPVGI